MEEETKDGPHGFWCCPTPGCDGKGFGFDIFPTDPDYRDEEGNLMWVSDEADGDEDEAIDDPDQFNAGEERGDNRKGGNGSNGNGRDGLGGNIPF